MKVAVLLAYVVLTTKRVTCAAIQAPLDIISLDDITESDRRHLEYLNSHYNYPPRPKRSHDDPLSSLKASIGQGIKAKLGALAKGSASASSKLSAGSSGPKYYHHDVHPEPHDHKSFDFWTLKKSILNTLLQAVKAIKGGVIAVKGQLIKGSGYLISAKGKLISAKGEAITNLGKNIATKAVLSSPNGHGHSEEYSHGHYHHSGPGEYGSPSAPGPEYEVPEHHYHHHPPHHEDKPDSDHAGILILKKIPKHHDSHEHSEHLEVEHKDHDHHKGPGFGEIIGKFFSASTSLKPGVPAPFGDDHHDHDHDHHHDSDHHHSDYHHSDHHHSDHHHSDHHHSDHQHYHHEPDHHHYPGHSSHSSHEEYRDSYPSHHESHHDHDYSHASSNENPKSTGLFEKAPDFLNLAQYASESKGAPPRAVTSTTTAKPKLEPQKLPGTPTTYDEIRPLPSALTDFDTSSFLANYDNKDGLFVGSLPNTPNLGFSSYSEMFPSAKPTAFSSDTSSLQFGAYPSNGPTTNLKYLAPTGGTYLGNTADGNIKFPSPTDVGPQVFPRQNAFNGANPTYPQAPKFHAYIDKGPLNRPTRSKSHRKRTVYPSPEFMKQLMYKLGRDEPTRL